MLLTKALRNLSNTIDILQHISLAQLHVEKQPEYGDLDVHIIVDEDNPCTNINHPIIDGVKLDLSFISFAQLKARTDKEMERRERIPMIAESWIVFDKTSQLAELQEQARLVKPKKILPDQYQFIQFMFYHGNNKVERNLDTDPVTALLVMHVGLNEFSQVPLSIATKMVGK